MKKKTYCLSIILVLFFLGANSYAATVTADATGDGAGTVSAQYNGNPGDINYSYPAVNTFTSADITEGTLVVMTAIASEGSIVEWTTCTGTVGGDTNTATCTFPSLLVDQTVEATFTPTWTITADAVGEGSGTVVSSIGGIDYSYPAISTETTSEIVDGTEVVLTATASEGMVVAWTTCSGTVGGDTNTATCTFSSLEDDQTVEATFTPTWTITADAVGEGSGTVVSSTGGIDYSYPAVNTETSSEIVDGTEVVLTATATGRSIVKWTTCGGTVGGNKKAATCSISIDSDQTVEATFDIPLSPALNAAIQAAANSMTPQGFGLTLVEEEAIWWGFFNGGRPTYYFQHFMDDYPATFTLTKVGCETVTVVNNGHRFETSNLILKQSDVPGRGMALTTQAGQCATQTKAYVRYYKEEMPDQNPPIIRY